MSSLIAQQNCSELFFSEYVEGSSQNKAIEIYNPTSTTINLGTYKVERYSNGATNSSSGGITNLSGMLASGDVFVLTHGDTVGSPTFGAINPALYLLGDMAAGPYPSPMHMNGNDAIALTNNGSIVDVIGQVGFNPVYPISHPLAGQDWGWTCDNLVAWTQDHTLIRKKTVLTGDYQFLDSFNPTLEWDSLPEDTWTNLGTHDCDCNSASHSNNFIDKVSYVVYPNPAVNTKVESIDIFNSSGTKVYTTNSTKFNTSKLSKGVYVMQITTKELLTFKQKVVVR
jgi:predicted extracellular nuclease